jgi:hypothetical protein
MISEKTTVVSCTYVSNIYIWTQSRERITAADLKAWADKNGLSTPPPQPDNGEGTRVRDSSLFVKDGQHVTFEQVSESAPACLVY